MDNLQLVENINRCKHLKHRFRGVFPADLLCSSILKNDNTFMIMNASPSDQPGTHWLLFTQAGGQIFFEDPLGKRLCDYPRRVQEYATYNSRGKSTTVEKTNTIS